MYHYAVYMYVLFILFVILVLICCLLVDQKVYEMLSPVQIERLLYIAMSGDERDTELILTKKLFVLHRVISFLYGPVAKR